MGKRKSNLREKSAIPQEPKSRGRVSADARTNHEYMVNLCTCQPWIPVIFAAAVVYSNAISGDFVLDDKEAIVTNKDVLGDNSMFAMFFNDFWGTQLSHPDSHKSYRPLTVLSFRLNHAFHGLWPTGFRLVNVALHSLVSGLLTWVVYMETSAPMSHATSDAMSLTKSSLTSAGWSSYLAMFCGLLFALHPLHCEAVASAVGRAEMMCALGFITAIVTCRKAGRCMDLKESCGWICLTVLASFVAMLCKETGITAIGVAAFMDLLLTVDVPPSVSRSMAKSAPSRWRLMLCRQAILWLGGVSMLTWRLSIMNGPPVMFSWSDNPASFAPEWSTRALTYWYLFARHMTLLPLPDGLCADWSGGSIPLLSLNQGGADLFPRILLPVFVTSFLLYLIILLLVVTWRQKRREVKGSELKQTEAEGAEVQGTEQTPCGPMSPSAFALLSLATILLPFLPASNLFFPVGFVIAERVMYVPSIGFCTLAALGLTHLLQHPSLAGRSSKSRPSLLLQFGVGCLLVSSSLKTLQRSGDWTSSLRLYSTGAAINPNSAKLQYNLGLALSESGADSDTVRVHYLQAIALHPDYFQAHTNLGVLYDKMGLLQDAEGHHRRAVEIHPDSAVSHDNLAQALQKQGRFTEANESYWRALQINPANPQTLNNYGLLYQSFEDYKLAAAFHQKSLEVDPDGPSSGSALSNLGNALARTRDFPGAAVAYEKALIKNPRMIEAMNNYAVLNIEMKRLEEAEKLLKRALTIHPNYVDALFNLANLEMKTGGLTKAEGFFRKVISLAPHHKGAVNNLGVALANNNRVKDAIIVYEEALKMPHFAHDSDIQTNLHYLREAEKRGK